MKFDKSDMILKLLMVGKVGMGMWAFCVQSLQLFRKSKIILKSWEKIVVFSHVNLESWLVCLKNPLEIW